MSESATMARVEGIGDALERLQSTLDKMDDRARVSEVATAVALSDIRAKVDNLRSLIDGVHARTTELEARIEKLETEAAEARGEKRRGTLVASGTGLAGGGLVAGLIELARRVLE